MWCSSGGLATGLRRRTHHSQPPPYAAPAVAAPAWLVRCSPPLHYVRLQGSQRGVQGRQRGVRYARGGVGWVGSGVLSVSASITRAPGIIQRSLPTARIRSLSPKRIKTAIIYIKFRLILNKMRTFAGLGSRRRRPSQSQSPGSHPALEGHHHSFVT